VQTSRLDVTIAIEGRDITDALAKGVPIFVEGLGVEAPRERHRRPHRQPV
jgi:hypothetical protein